ncbi:hypothetical protein, partial [Silanimonas lenta]|uniref:hypothetical protein n=1 Tax=Silanimonas lenta TaxID=265429 RepID=UPI001B7FA769
SSRTSSRSSNPHQPTEPSSTNRWSEKSRQVIPKCYGVAEMIHGLVAGACAALGILFFLVLRHSSVARDRRRAAREAKLQWWLIGISLLAFLAMIALP